MYVHVHLLYVHVPNTLHLPALHVEWKVYERFRHHANGPSDYIKVE